MSDIFEIDKELMNKAIEIVKENRDTFSITLLKKELHKGIITCNVLIDELEESGFIRQHNIDNDLPYRIEVLI